MVTLKEACSIIQEELPNNRIIRCSEIGDYYFFNMPPRRWNGDKNDVPCGGSVYYVKKDGTFDCMNIENYMDLLLEYDEKELDVRPYLDAEDRAFLKRLKEP